jgi:putative membrane protein
MDSAALVTLADHAHGWGVGWWPIFPLLWIGFWAFVVFMFFRFRRRGGPWHGGPSGESVLAERYARGEIDDKEYRERLTVLKERSR